jgi:hypothetical protein
VASEPISDSALRHHLGQELDPAMHPAFFVWMEAFPLNLHGKVNRRALPPPVGLLYRERACVPPESEAEASLARIWSEILEIAPIGVTHGFAELGGDSLKAIRVLGRIAQRLGAEVPLPELFPRGTVRGLAARIAAPTSSHAILPPTAAELRLLGE